MSLFTPIRRHHPDVSATATSPDLSNPTRFEHPGETTVYVTNSRAGEVAAKFVSGFGKKFLERAGIAHGAEADQIVQQTVEALPLLGWKAAVAAEYRAPYQGIQNTGEISPVTREHVFTPVHEAESDDAHDLREAKHREESLLTGAGAALVMGSMALALSEKENINLLNRFDVAHANDMLAAGQPDTDNPTRFHYDLV